MSAPFDLDTITLDSGSHDRRTDGVCVMEAVAWWAGEDHSDHPECVSPVIGAFLRSWNDALPDGDRQQLRRWIPDSSGDALTLLGGAQLSLIEALSRLRALRMELAIGSTSNAEGAS